MKSFILSMALFCAVTQARRERTIDRQLDDDDDVDDIEEDKLVFRDFLPSGMEADENIPGDCDKKFLRWINKYNPNYKDMNEYRERFEIWKATNRTIRKNNRKAERSGDPTAVFLDHNHFSDWNATETGHLLSLTSQPKA